MNSLNYKDNNIDTNNNNNTTSLKSNSKSDDDTSPENVFILPPSKQKYDLCFKIIVIGNCGVGKTSLTYQAVQEKFSTAYHSTVGLDFFTMFLKIEDKIIKLQIWDTCGQEVYRSLVKNFYRDASLALMVYSIDDEKSFQDIDLWIKELKTCSNPDSKMILIGNKSDLENRQITYEIGKSFAKDYDFVDFLETSAKTGYNAKEVFIKSTKILYNNYKKYEEIKQEPSDGSYSSYTKRKPRYSRRLDVYKNISSGCCHS